MRIKTLFAASALALTTPLAFAQTDANTATMGMVEVLQSLEQSGYTAFDDIDREGFMYEVTATNANGEYVEITVDGRTGEVVNSELED